MEFADSSASEICATCSLPLLEYTIPIINEFVKKGPFKHQRLFMIMGHDQSYKTSIAVELLTPFLSFKNLECESVWLDCEFLLHILVFTISKKMVSNKPPFSKYI